MVTAHLHCESLVLSLFTFLITILCWRIEQVVTMFVKNYCMQLFPLLILKKIDTEKRKRTKAIKRGEIF